MFSLRQWLLDHLQPPPEDDLDGYPFGIVIDGHCNYATERTILYGPDMQVMGIRWEFWMVDWRDATNAWKRDELLSLPR